MRITQATSLSGYRLDVRFDNGETGVVDLSALVGVGVFSAWEDPEHFNRVSVTVEGALEWPGELDLCPDSVYLRMTGKRAEDLFPSLKHEPTHA